MGRTPVKGRQDPNGKLGIAATIRQDEQGVQVVARVTGDHGGEGSGDAHLKQALAPPLVEF